MKGKQSSTNSIILRKLRALPIKACDHNVNYLNLIKQPFIVVTVVIVTFKALKPIYFQLKILSHTPSLIVRP